MDIIFTDKSGIDAGVLSHFTLDHEESNEDNKNTFEIQTSIDVGFEIGSLIYANNTEFGGRIEKIVTDTSKSLATYSGSSWRGLLSKKIIKPDDGEDYYIVSGDLNDILGTLIARCDLGAYFIALDTETINISNYKIYRYVTLYSAILKLLSEYGYKLNIDVVDGKAIISAELITDFEQIAEVNSDLFSFKMTRQKYTCNHLVALGSGELAQRLVIDKYVQADGSIGDVQHYFGINEVTELYEDNNTKSIEDLEIKAIDALSKKSIDDGLNITAYDLKADIGDKITAKDLKQKISVTQYVIDKIVTINDDFIKYQYKVGDTL